jgi:hypothetical protein
VGGVDDAFSGVDTRSPFDAYTGTVGAVSTSLVAPGLSTVADNVLLVSFAALNAQTTVTPGAGMSELYDLQSGTTLTVEAATESFPSAGATGARTATAGSAGVYATHLVALRPAAAHPAPLYRIVTDYLNSNGGTVSIAQPTGSTAGDLLVLAATWAGGTTNAPVTPSGWTTIRIDANGTNVSTGWWYRGITGGETWPVSFGPSSSVPMIALLTLLRNADTTTPISGSAVSTGTGTTMTAAGIAATNSHSVTMSVFADTDTTNAISGAGAGTAWDDMVYNNRSTSYVNAGFSHDIATAAATGTPSWLLGASKPWIATSVSFSPAPDTYTINANLS